MANSRMKLSEDGTTKLDLVMAELPSLKSRPETLKVALAKGIADSTGEPPLSPGKGWEIPAGVVAKEDDYLIYKHLMIEKLGFQLEGQKQIDDYLLRFIEEGLRIMADEIKSLSNMSNYMLYLVDKAH